jgi:hypothetical protein
LERDWFTKCANALDNWDAVTQGAYMPAKMINQLEGAYGLKFPLANNNPGTNPRVNTTLIGQLIGTINRNFENANPLVTGMIDNDFVNPDQGYRQVLEQ